MGYSKYTRKSDTNYRMKLAHQIELTVFSYPDENYDSILQSFKELIPYDLEKEKIKIDTRTAAGFNERQIKTLKAVFTKTMHINSFLKNISEKLDDEQKILLINQVETRLDEELKFFLRFDKEELLKNKKLILTDSGKCFHIKISIAAFPRKRENALRAIKKIFNR